MLIERLDVVVKSGNVHDIFFFDQDMVRSVAALMLYAKSVTPSQSDDSDEP